MTHIIEAYSWLKHFWKWAFFWKWCFRGNSVLWKMLHHIVMLPLKVEKILMQCSQEDLGEMEPVPSVHHKKPLVPPKKPLCSAGIAAGWEKASCPCRHCLWPHQLLLRSVVTAHLPTQTRKPGHPGASPLCPRLLTQYLGIIHHPQHQLLGRAYGEGLQSEQAHKWAHRACLLGVTVPS